MDKGLIKIKELENRFNYLNTKISNNQKKIEILESDSKDLQDEKSNLDAQLPELKECVSRIQNSPKKFKRIILQIIAVLLILLPISTILFSAGGAAIYHGGVLMMFSVAFTVNKISEYIKEKTFLKQNPLGELNEWILELEQVLHDIEVEMNLNKSEISSLNQENIKLKNETKNIETKMSNLNSIRRVVIESYLKNNNEIDELLNKSYDSLKQR